MFFGAVLFLGAALYLGVASVGRSLLLERSLRRAQLSSSLLCVSLLFAALVFALLLWAQPPPGVASFCLMFLLAELSAAMFSLATLLLVAGLD